MSHQDTVFAIQCDCCGARIHVDPRRRNVFYTEKPGDPKLSYEEMVEKVKTINPAAQDAFAAGLQSEKDKESKLENLFKKAKKKADADPNQRPPSIWDHE